VDVDTIEQGTGDLGVVALDLRGCAPALMIRIREIPTRAPIHCNFFTKPKISLTVHKPKLLPKGYPQKPRNLGERLRKKRMDMGLFQKDIAKIIGVSTDTITYWEKGRTHPTKQNLEKVIDFLNKQDHNANGL